ncbi:MAG: type II toxin-antitoxin system VapC family toxin [Pseudomonadota bacterium]
MSYLLDTNTCIYFLNRSSEKIISKMKSLSPSNIRLSSITVAELFFGAEKSKAKKKNWTIVQSFIGNFELIPFDEKCCENYAKIRVSLEKFGSPIGPMDLLIASITLAHNLILVTNNVKEFRRIRGLKLENWI